MGSIGERNPLMDSMDDDELDIKQREGLPQYALRVSTRAKRMQLKVNHWGRVEVVVPRNVSVRHVAPFVNRHRRWLERALAEVHVGRDESHGACQNNPSEVHLAAVGEDWEIHYLQGPKARIVVTDQIYDRRKLLVETDGDADVRSSLQAWVHDYARQRLPPWLSKLSEECGLHYTRASVRAQKTRWGSCGSEGNINLNRHLLFLPPRLVRYVMIHELCHTVHLNHSRRYWTLVSRFVPDYKECESELRRAAGYIPRWACPE